MFAIRHSNYALPEIEISIRPNNSHIPALLFLMVSKLTVNIVQSCKFHKRFIQLFMCGLTGRLCAMSGRLADGFRS